MGYTIILSKNMSEVLYLDETKKYPITVLKDGIVISGYKFSTEYLEACKVVIGHDKGNVILGCDAKKPFASSVYYRWVPTPELIDTLLSQIQNLNQ